ncbi:SusC/RagA family TonB-linked outer membrane protein [Spirosoma utsteinense]|uniref:TonB-linked SusC/RagA family outer membrane protein n=1 Tax=Spirosoma utsteinense TaxID=2585773 RepID=A0ABR6WED6_9BACT|nr:TonB-dependent receptor [Spirosoma utsteinense]MBC3787512.1 TonB-linked SusC/RagA family outer membrane protein [Spirosoma utsteinense]MBC3794897.1 TonB-linked SusC/RagA family outer membrane protein [Spirosoma utsteinense]
MKKLFLFVYFLYISTAILWAQNRTISGVVTSSEDSDGLPGINIMLKGTTTGTTSDASGSFRLSVPNQGGTLLVSSIGFESQEVAIGNQSSLTIKLQTDTKQLSEVVITGYGTQSQKTLTGSIASVSGKSIENIPAPSSDQLLQGRAAGVQVSANSGTPGGGIQVRVRGTTSINGSSDPLYVVDGIPIQSNNLSGIGLGGSTTNPIADINPSDIASIEILKDASATAIYGARAANGVVLITTKRGANKKAKISFGTYQGAQSLWRKPASVDGPTFETLINEAAVNNGQKPVYADPAKAINTNWSDPVFHTGALRNYDLSIAGGSEKVQYLVSVNNFLQEGVVRGSDFKRTSGRVNLDFTPIDKVRIGTSILYSRNDRNLIRSDDNISGALSGAFFLPPNLPVYQADGSYTKFGTFENPVAAVDHNNITMRTNRFLANVYGQVDILPGLNLRSTFSLDYSNAQEDLYDNTFLNNGASRNGFGQSVSTRDNNWIQENVLTYQRTFGDHSINALVGTSVQESVFERTTATGEQFPSNDFTRIISAAVQRGTSEGTSWGIASLFGRVVYDYKSRYLATVNVRRDGSSRFGRANRWGTFPSVAVGWLLSEEDFLKDLSFLNILKVRASYGMTGNQSGITNFQSIGLWGGNLDDLGAISGSSAYVDLPGTAPIQLANQNLKWETTTQTNVGLDLGILKNRVKITADYYIKNTTDLLLAVPVPRTSGFNTLVQNYGSVQNKGFELGINADILKGGDSQPEWNVNFNIATNKNKITKLAAPFTVYNRDIFRYEEGYPMYSFYLHEQTGVDPEKGNPTFTDVNGDGKFDPNVDRKIVGNAIPKFFGGITNTLNFKGFDLMFFFQYSYGNKQLHWNRFFTEHGGTRNTNFLASQLDRWQKPGDQTMVPQLNAANYAGNLRPSRFMEDGSYLRLKNISVGYTLPKALLDKVHLSNVRVFVSGQNVLTFTKYTGLDPEMTGTASTNLTQGIEFFTMPQPKVYMAGINLSF